ncbi:MAG: DUF3536 domain-containing protein [Syntrophobacteraceae bacterium]|nr:DUF3536 domain-containing protein [Syntrophobacteraceae bacterium]
MDNRLDKKYICVHAHFYQPPRENPWIEAIEREDSAAPYHDWNERIHQECYRANTGARIVDERNRILDLVNNYSYLSFNFGPTLMSWIERHHPWVYRKILEADRRSVEALSGHGNAIAQVYNHIIMPLANRRDKLTQIRWGMGDFEHRFGRPPEGMWLAETAVDRETLLLLAQEGIKYTILSPLQGMRWRFRRGETTWRDASGGTIPTGRAYRYSCGEGKYIHLFFYDSALARGIAFDRLLEHSSRLLEQIERSWSFRPPTGEPWMVNVATDGETYGHHFKFGDMALGAAFNELRRDPAAQIVNYGWFLASFPVVAEVEIVERTAWSCAHGLGRWSADCGCHLGGEPGWNQKWRAPLRLSFDYLRDALSDHFQKEMAKLTQEDPWEVRDAYIESILERKGEGGERFLTRYLTGGANSLEVSRFLALLEMERFALFMYTSCGWFFDEISQLESVLVLTYAARAIDLAKKTGACDPSAGFLELLESAPSNRAEYANGANVFIRKARSGQVDMARVAASYAIQSVSARRQFRLYAYEILPQKEEDLGASPVACLYGLITVQDDRTAEGEDFLFAVAHFGGLDFRCSVKAAPGEGEYESILAALQDAIEEQSTIKMVRVLDEKFGTDYFGLGDVLKDLRTGIAREIGRKTLEAWTGFQRNLFAAHKPLLLSLRQWGIKMSADLEASMQRILSEEVEGLCEKIVAHEFAPAHGQPPWDATDFYFRVHLARVGAVLEEAKSWGVALDLGQVSEHLGGSLVKVLSKLALTFDERDAGRLLRLLALCRAMQARPESWKLQTLFFEFVTKGIENPGLLARINRIEDLVNELDSMLNCGFARILEKK